MFSLQIERLFLTRSFRTRLFDHAFGVFAYKAVANLPLLQGTCHLILQ